MAGSTSLMTYIVQCTYAINDQNPNKIPALKLKLANESQYSVLTPKKRFEKNIGSFGVFTPPKGVDVEIVLSTSNICMVRIHVSFFIVFMSVDYFCSLIDTLNVCLLPLYYVLCYSLTYMTAVKAS